MRRLKIKELSLRFRTNLLIAKIKEEIQYRQTVKGYSINEIFSGRTQRDSEMSSRLTDFNQG